jgi:hypothetical protein
MFSFFLNFISYLFLFLAGEFNSLIYYAFNSSLLDSLLYMILFILGLASSSKSDPAASLLGLNSLTI